MSYVVKIHVVLSLLMGIGQPALGRPSWTQTDSFIRIGDTLRLICNGTAPSLDLARKAAEDSCISTAIRQVRDQITLRSTTISTEKDVALHEEISEQTTVRNLKCYPEKEANENRGDTVEVWLLCRFQLDKGNHGI